MERLKKRPDFVLAAKSPYVWKRPAFVVQLRTNTGSAKARIGYTVTKRQGNAVVRNRIKRRLREVVREDVSKILAADCDYVLIGRSKAATMRFENLQKEMYEAFVRIHSKAGIKA